MAYGLTVQNWKKTMALMPKEDSFSIDNENQIFAVANGITRDPYRTLPDMNRLKGQIMFAINYPRLRNPAKIAANIFTQTFPEVIRDYESQNRDETTIRLAFEEANNRIRRWNEAHIPSQDYLTKDLAGCVASGLVLNNGTAYYGFITDCGITLLSESGEIQFQTPNQGPKTKDREIWADKRLQELTWADPEARKIVRSKYRNNPSEKSAFGVLTGEQEAMNYVVTGSLEIKPRERLILHSDGLEEILNNILFRACCINNNYPLIKKLCQSNVQTEGTLIVH